MNTFPVLPSANKQAYGRDLVSIAEAAAPKIHGVRQTRLAGIGRCFCVHVTDAETGQGKYKCDVYSMASSYLNDPTADFSDDAIDLSPTLFENALYINLPEYGISGHVLTAAGNVGSLYGIGLLIDHTEQGRMILVGQIYREEDCTEP